MSIIWKWERLSKALSFPNVRSPLFPVLLYLNLHFCSAHFSTVIELQLSCLIAFEMDPCTGLGMRYLHLSEWMAWPGVPVTQGTNYLKTKRPVRRSWSWWINWVIVCNFVVIQFWIVRAARRKGVFIYA